MSALVTTWAVAVLAAAPVSGSVRVGPGTVTPLYQAPDDPPAQVEAFRMDRHAVTNAEYLRFVKQHPEWRRDRVKALFADPQYLDNWSGPAELGPLAPANAPVTKVSWFAARAYCKSRGARLPTENEWELAAKAGSDEPGFTSRILAWYGRPTPKVLPEVASGKPNPLGLYDLHGLVWEWVSDFGNSLVDGDSRGGADSDKSRFCGAGALTAGDKSDYAAFMRVAFRSSLEGHYTIANLGFRCAKDLP